jgi:isopenicillin N synthase-like dioxygenase
VKTVPTIDIRNIDHKAKQEIDEACIDHGFFKIRGHGLDDMIDEMWCQASAFFSAPREFKQTVRRPADGAFGFFDSELTQQKRDLKEVFDYAPEAVPLFGNTSKPFWPSGSLLDKYSLEHFQKTLGNFYVEQTKVAKLLMEILCETLGEPRGTLDDLFGEFQTSTARLNYYPSVDTVPEVERDPGVELNTVALGAHTDPGAVTLLLQDNIGGLQAESTESGWIDVEPEEYTFIINIGDIVQAWSNGRYKAAVHRVLKVPAGKSRFSMPFFYMPKAEAIIKPIMSNEMNQYREFSWGEFIQKRIADNYEKVGDSDMQVTDFMMSKTNG